LDEYITRHEYMERTGRTDDKMNNLDRRLSKVEELSDKLTDMAITMKGMLTTLENMQKEQSEQGERLRKIEEEPADAWKNLKWTIVACLASGLVGLVLAKVGIL